MNTSYMLTVVLFALACGKTSVPSEPSLEGHWTLVSLEGTPIVKKERFNITFKGNVVRGGTGCNQFDGTAKQTGSQLDLRDISVTEMSCDLREQEDAYVKALSSTRSFSVNGDALEFRGISGIKLISFQR